MYVPDFTLMMMNEESYSILLVTMKEAERVAEDIPLCPLQTVIENLEKDDITLEQSFQEYQKGMLLVKKCNEIIDKVENDRVYEEHYQKTYDVETYIELLEKIGFKNIKLYSDFSKYGTEW